MEKERKLMGIRKSSSSKPGFQAAENLLLLLVLTVDRKFYTLFFISHEEICGKGMHFWEWLMVLLFSTVCFVN